MKVLTSLQGKWISLGGSQQTYIGVPVYLPGVFEKRIYEVSGCEQESLDIKLEDLFSVKFTKMISGKLNVLVMLFKTCTS